MTSDPVARYLATHGARLGRRERLRVMTSGEVLDTALRAYRQLGWSYLRLTVVPAVFCLGGIAFVLDYVLPSFAVTQHAGDIGAQVAEAATSGALALFLGGPLFLLGMSYTCAVVVHLTADFMMGNVPRPEVAAQAARNSFGTLVSVAFRELLLSCSGIIVSGLLMGLGALLSQATTSDEAALPGLLVLLGSFGLAGGCGIFLYVMAMHALAPAVAILEGVSGKAAGKRSTYLLKAQANKPGGAGNLLSAYFYIFFAGAIEWMSLAGISAALQLDRHVAALFSGMPLQGLISSAFGLLAPFMVVWTLLPVWAACVTIVYYERRIRLEGFDIEVLAAEIDQNSRTSRFDV
ncbi:MAG TPA: hypothetical protein VG944_24145 [Fimbriimonas sp.]|nr:hypothetical protein [Fimbriimonas sp.]